MNEKVLDLLLRLFAIIASENRVSFQERKAVRNFFTHQINEEMAKIYVETFLRYARDPEPEDVRAICEKVNPELTLAQKYFVVLSLAELVLADNILSELEEELLNQVAASLRLSEEDYQLIFQFIRYPIPIVNQEPSPAELANKAWILSAAYNHVVADGYKKVIYEHFNGIVGLLYLPNANLLFARFVAPEEVYLNGQLVNEGNTYVLNPGSVIRYPQGTPIYYSDLVRWFQTGKREEEIVMEVRNISFRYGPEMPVLRGVDLMERSGRLVAIMGQSGSGKSTLIQILSGQLTPNTGEVLINGRSMLDDDKRLAALIGFVPQDDQLINELTVYENLLYAARLYFGGRSEAELRPKIDKLLDDMGLTAVHDKRVGTPLQKRISGGQRKRLNIALELIREPPILFVDEPTSGLSSADSEQVMDLLKELANRDKLVFTIIHQPSSNIFKLFDSLLLLDQGGYPIYYGNPLGAISYFKREVEYPQTEVTECPTCGNVNAEQVFSIAEAKLLDERGLPTPQRKFTPAHWNERYRDTVRFHVPNTIPPVPDMQVRRPSFLKQLKLFLQRDVLMKWRSPNYLTINLLAAPILALTVGFVLRFSDNQLGGTGLYNLYRNPNLVVFLLTAGLVAIFLGLIVSAEEILKDRKIRQRERFLSLNRDSYLLAKITVLTAITALQTALFIAIGHWILDIEGMFLYHWVLAMATGMASLMLGLNLSASFNSAVTVYIIVPIILIPQLTLSGAIVPFNKLNLVLNSPTDAPILADAMFSRWVYEGMTVAQYRENRYERHLYDVNAATSRTEYELNHWYRHLENEYARLAQNLNRGLVRPQDHEAWTLLANELRAKAKEVPPQLGNRLTAALAPSLRRAQVEELETALAHLRHYLVAQMEHAHAQRDERIRQLRDQGMDLEDLRRAHANKVLSDVVRNRQARQPALAYKGRLVQLNDPIYHHPNPEHVQWLGGQHYAGNKRLGRALLPTHWFNTLVLLAFVPLLYLLLRYEALRLAVNLPVLLRRRRPLQLLRRR